MRFDENTIYRTCWLFCTIKQYIQFIITIGSKKDIYSIQCHFDFCICRNLLKNKVSCIFIGRVPHWNVLIRNVRDLIFLYLNKSVIGCRSPPIDLNLKLINLIQIRRRKMKNYKDSDYARNKYSPNMVYKFADSSINEVTQEKYLGERAKEGVKGYAKLKKESNDIFHKDAIYDNKECRHTVPIEDIDEKAFIQDDSILDSIIEREEKDRALAAAKELLERGKLTEEQKRRFIQHYFHGLSTREIGKQEGVSHIAIYKSIKGAKEKLIKNFNKMG